MLNLDSVVVHGVPVALILLAMVLLLPWFRQLLFKRRIEKGIAHLGVRQLRNFMLDDGIEGKVYIERLLLHSDGLLLLAENWRDGHIFGGDRIDNWAQVMGNRTYKFGNPLYSLETALAALRYHAPGMGVTGKILFLGDCSFPKGQPESVLSKGDLTRVSQEERSRTINPKLQLAWDNLEGMIEAATQEELGVEQDKTWRGQKIAAGLLVTVAVGWWSWHLCTL